MNTQEQLQEQGRGVMILIFGILSIVLLGPILGIPAWVMGKNDLRKIQEGRIPESEKSMTKAGMILGIIGTLLVAVAIIFGIIAAVLIGIAGSNNV